MKLVKQSTMDDIKDLTKPILIFLAAAIVLGTSAFFAGVDTGKPTYAKVMACLDSPDVVYIEAALGAKAAGVLPTTKEEAVKQLVAAGLSKAEFDKWLAAWEFAVNAPEDKNAGVYWVAQCLNK